MLYDNKPKGNSKINIHSVYKLPKSKVLDSFNLNAGSKLEVSTDRLYYNKECDHELNRDYNRITYHLFSVIRKA